MLPAAAFRQPTPFAIGPNGRIDPTRVAQPWMWNGLCAAIAPLDGVLRDYVSGAAPSTVNVPTVGRDPRGGQTAFASGSVVALQDFTANGRINSPDTALTVFMRLRPNQVNVTSSGWFSKVYSTSTPFDTWLIWPGTGTNQLNARLSITVASTFTTGTNVALGATSVFTNIWLRWSSGAAATLDCLSDAGVATGAQTSTTALTGSLSYPAAPQPLRVFGDDAPTRASAGGDFSLGMVWNRKLSDQEMYAVTADQFGALRRAV